MENDNPSLDKYLSLNGHKVNSPTGHLEECLAKVRNEMTALKKIETMLVGALHDLALLDHARIQDLDKKIAEAEKKKHDDFNALVESLPEGEPREEPTIEEQEQILWGQYQEEVEFHNNNNEQ